MQNIRKRIQTLERFQSLKGGTASDQIVQQGAGACFRCRLALAGKRGSCPGARARVDPGGVRRGGSLRLRNCSGIRSAVRSRGRTTETMKIIERLLKLEDRAAGASNKISGRRQRR